METNDPHIHLESSVQRLAIHAARLTAAQKDALEAIGDALKRRLIDFFTATELGDRVRQGHVDEVRATLNEITKTNVPTIDPPKFDPTNN